MANFDIWSRLARPPRDALKSIGGGRLKGMTDVNPQWRLEAMTKEFGPIGIGWNYNIVRTWREVGAEGEVAAFAEIGLWYTVGDKRSDLVPGIGGSMLVTNERGGPRTNDEAIKMAITDALSVAMKQIGVAADIYAGRWDGSKYRDPPPSNEVETDDTDPETREPSANHDDCEARAKKAAESGELSETQLRAYRARFAEARGHADALEAVVADMENNVALSRQRAYDPSNEGTPDHPDVTAGEPEIPEEELF